tara:strand:- start:113 stop:565 length:453 start_codon:yes stop_codon:yes gene_type:complete
MNNIISNCPLCDKHALHLVGKEEYQMQQCINCGYVTFEKFKLNKKPKEKHEEYLKLTDDMKKWVKISTDRFWTPTIFTLPSGMLYPFDDENGSMKWKMAEMVDISEEDQEKYPDPNGGFYKKKYDIQNAKIYDEFVVALSELNNHMKNEN